MNHKHIKRFRRLLKNLFLLWEVYISRCHLKWSPNKWAHFSSQFRAPQIMGWKRLFLLSRKHKAEAINLNTCNVSLQDNPFLLPFTTPWHPILWYFNTESKKKRKKKQLTRPFWRHLAEPCLGEKKSCDLSSCDVPSVYRTLIAQIYRQT